MSKKQRTEYIARNELVSQGWEIEKGDRVCFHSAGESNQHFVCKAQAAYFLGEQGYRVDSEVENQYSGAIADLVVYGKDEPPFVVECETGVTPQVKTRKLEQFYHDEPFCECFILEVQDLPEDRAGQLEWIAANLGGEI